MAKFKDLPHGQHVQHAELVSHIRPMHWDRRSLSARFKLINRQARKFSSRGQNSERVAGFSPALLDPRKLLGYPLKNLYQRIKKGCSHLF